MQKRRFQLFRIVAIAAWLCTAGCASHARTVAYWRFEEGKPGTVSGVGNNLVADSAGEANSLSVAAPETEPTYVADVPFSKVPRTGAPDAVAARFSYTNDFFTRDGKINTYDFSPTGSNAWTVELSFKLLSVDGVTRLCGRDGTNTGAEQRGPLQILTNGTPGDTKFDLRAEILDSTNTFRDVVSPATFTIGRWYNMAATANATTLSLYADQMDGRGYQLVGTKSIAGALNTTSGSFSIGRGWNGRATDWINGEIDEVRISDTALDPTQFLFEGPTTVPAPPPPAAPARINLFMGADPDIAYFNDQFWMYPTGQRLGPQNQGFYTYSSPDLKNWTKHGPIFQFKDAPWIYAQGDFNRWAWAPSAIEKDGKYYFYYAVGPQGQQPSYTGVAVGDSPVGPFVDKGAPLVSGGNGFEAIDPMVFHDPVSGQYYLYGGGSAGAKLRAFELAPDMMSIAREIPVDTPRNFTEGVYMHYRDGVYYISYSHGGWNGPTYSVYYSTSKTPFGPWEYKGPILVSDETHKGPGHHAILHDPRTGQWYIVYHRWQSPTGGNPFKAGGRSIAIDTIKYAPNGDILPVKMTDSGIPHLVEAPVAAREEMAHEARMPRARDVAMPRNAAPTDFFAAATR